MHPTLRHPRAFRVLPELVSLCTVCAVVCPRIPPCEGCVQRLSDANWCCGRLRFGTSQVVKLRVLSNHRHQPRTNPELTHTLITHSTQSNRHHRLLRQTCSKPTTYYHNPATGVCSEANFSVQSCQAALMRFSFMALFQQRGCSCGTWASPALWALVVRPWAAAAAVYRGRQSAC